MDNLYEDLENYEDENIVDELKRENIQLKSKLEEYSVAMEKLQKDFNKLSSEFKILEKNYSSLLKTAKQEIERKSHIITKLNTEKDMMVLNAIQNKNISEVRRITTFTAKHGNDRSNIAEKLKTKIEDIITSKGSAVENDRQELHRLPSEETVTSNSTDIVSKSSRKHFDNCSKKTNDSKENISNSQKLLHNDVDAPKSKALSIKNRRKSLPAVRCEAKFSSDEEYDDGNVKLVKYSSINRYETVNNETKLETFNKAHNEVFKSRFLDDRHRGSETSTVDDKCPNYHDRKDNKNRNRCFDSDKFRNRDKNDTNRIKRHQSPERSRRHTRQYTDEHYLKEEYRYRALESPPPEKYSYQRRNREPRPRYNREEYYNYERNKDRCENKYPAKHKLMCNPEEPSSKRRRNNSNTYYQEDKRRDTDRLSIQNSIPIITDNIDHTSCQSPDYIIPDASSSHPVKEIMNTAATQLEDPRLQSKRYILQYLNDDAVLSTVMGRNVDLKVIDTSNWNIEQVDIPKALKRRPSQCSEDFVKDVYMDIENPVSNISIESGEILSYATDDEISDKRALGPYNHNEICTVTENRHKAVNRDNFREGIFKSKYKIPKLKMNHNVTEFEPNTGPINCNGERDVNKSLIFASNKGNTYMCKDNTDIPSDNIDTPNVNIDSINTPKEVLQPKIYKSSTQKVTIVVDEPELSKHEPTTISSGDTNKKIVEGDLELSDETNDYVDLHKKTFIESDNTKSRDSGIIKHIADNTTPFTLKNDNLHLKNNTTEDDIDKHLEKDVQDNNKKQKPKKRSQKLSNKDLLKNEKSETNPEKRAKSKKDKIETKQVKTKFSELFGDSSSLITPEDLGIHATQAHNQPPTKYIPVCEDAQDAVDLKVIDLKDDQNTNLKVEKVQNNVVINSPCMIEHKAKFKADKVTVDNKKKKSNKNEIEDGPSSYHGHIKLQQPDSQSKIEIDKNDIILSTSVNEIVTDNIDLKKILQTTVIQNLMPRPNTLIEALATSTPHKDIKDNPVICSTLPKNNCDNNNMNHDKIMNIDNNYTAAEQSSNNDTMDSQTDIDTPDVRIFVKRRRRLVKK